MFFAPTPMIRKETNPNKEMTKRFIFSAGKKSLANNRHISAEKIIIVTQKYHLYRALYLAKQFDIDAKGVSADLMTYQNQAYFSSREALARIKDYFYAIFKPLPTYLGDKIEIK